MGGADGGIGGRTVGRLADGLSLRHLRDKQTKEPRHYSAQLQTEALKDGGDWETSTGFLLLLLFGLQRKSICAGRTRWMTFTPQCSPGAAVSGAVIRPENYFAGFRGL